MRTNHIPRCGLIFLGAVLVSAPAFAQSNYRILTSLAFTRCLDIPEGDTGNKVAAQIFNCNGGNNQRWTFTYVDVPNGWGTLRNTATGKCLDVRASGMTTGAVVQQYNCNGADNQLWRSNVLQQGTLQVKHSGLCAGPLGSTDRSKIRQIFCVDPNGQPYPNALWGWELIP